MSETATTKDAPMSLLSMLGIYHATKSMYMAFVPNIGRDIMESVCERLIHTVSPLLAKVVKETPAKDFEVPSDLSQLDALVISCLVMGDEKIDSLFGGSKALVASRYHEAKVKAVGKVGEAKAFVVTKYEEVKPVMVARVENAKAAVMNEQHVVKVIGATKPYYDRLRANVDMVKENVEPTKAMLSEVVTSVKNEVADKGVVGYTKEKAESFKAQGIDAIKVVKAKGAVEGVKELSSSAMAVVTRAIEKEKARPTACVDDVMAKASGGVSKAACQAASLAASPSKMVPSELYSSADEDENEVKH
jgi:hypothetical protein